MKKLKKLNDSKLEKFASNEIQNSQMIFGGEKYDTTIVSNGKSDGLDTECCDGSYVSWDGGKTWDQCDFTVWVSQMYGVKLPQPVGVITAEKEEYKCI